MNSTIGVDTSWLVQLTLAEAPGHAQAEATLAEVISAGEKFALTPFVMSEFAHVVTDAKRFSTPLTFEEALEAVDVWWNAPEVVHYFESDESLRLAWMWMRQFNLGRKRILDTQLAALFHVHGIDRILTANSRDYSVFGCFELLS